VAAVVVAVVSWAAVQAVIARMREPDCDWSAAEFRAMLMLADHHNGKTGQCNPSLELLGDECHTSTGGAATILDRLVDKKAIRRLRPSTGGRRKGGGGFGQAYELLLPGLETLTPRESSDAGSALKSALRSSNPHTT
jgi:hypothetical protein